MSNAVTFDFHAPLASTFEWPEQRGRFTTAGLIKIERQTLPTDPIGTTSVAFFGVNVGTEIRVYLQDGTEIAGVEVCAENQVLTWPVYAPGPNSTVYITMLLRGYRWQRFDYTPIVGNQTLPIFQIVDLGYNNPA